MIDYVIFMCLIHNLELKIGAKNDVYVVFFIVPFWCGVFYVCPLKQKLTVSRNHVMFRMDF